MSPRPASFARSAPVRWMCRGLLGSALASLTGCSVLSPSPTLELVKAAGIAAGVAVSRAAPVTASSTAFHLPAGLSALCIEYNPTVPLPDLVNALQVELRQHDVATRVLEAHAPPETCTHWLRYQAGVAWDTRPTDRRLEMYLERLDLVVQDSRGRVLSHSSLDPVDGWFTGKWASTRTKVAPVVKSLLDGQVG